MPDQTAVLEAAPDQTPVHATDSPEPQTGPALVDADWLDVVRRVRDAYPDWQIRLPTFDEVQAIDGRGRSRAGNIRAIVQTADLGDGQTMAAAPEAKPVQTAPKPKRPKPIQTERQAPVKEAVPQSVQVTATPTAPQTKPKPAVVKEIQTAPSRRPPRWPVLAMTAPAFVAIWSGWVGVGGLTGFGVVHPLPGIFDSLAINTAITLPFGMEVYAAYALWVWLSGRGTDRAVRFARRSAIGALILGALGQVAYHLMVAAKVTHAPWPITTAVACLPVAVLGMGAALAHLNSNDRA